MLCKSQSVGITHNARLLSNGSFFLISHQWALLFHPSVLLIHDIDMSNKITTIKPPSHTKKTYTTSDKLPIQNIGKNDNFFSNLAGLLIRVRAIYWPRDALSITTFLWVEKPRLDHDSRSKVLSPSEDFHGNLTPGKCPNRHSDEFAKAEE